MRNRHLVWSMLTLAAGALAGCSDSPTETRLAASYRLASVNGLPVPAALDSAVSEPHHFFYRIVGRSIEILDRDSAQYSWATDGVERLPDGTLKRWAWDCTSVKVAYRRSGDRLFLTREPANVSPPSAGFPPPEPRIADTLQVQASRLLHTVREAPTIHHPEGRILKMEYQEGRPASPVCG